jgi:hypothetical protein
MTGHHTISEEVCKTILSCLVKPVIIAFCGVRSGNPGRLKEQRECVEYAPQSLDFTQLGFYL